MEIEVRHLKKCYGTKTVFTDLNMSFEKGTTTCLMGESGCGKTTLLRILMGLDMQDFGTVTGLDHERLSVVFQEDRLCENLSAGANVRLVMNSGNASAIDEGFKRMGLVECLHQPVRELSGGMRRRVSLLRALLADFDILLMDEPFKGLDEQTKEVVIAYTKACCKGKTVICVTHDEAEAIALGGRIVRL